MSELIYKEEAYKIIGAAIEVHKELGNGFLEAVYQEALGIEFDKRQILFDREAHLEIQYKGILLNKSYIADFICYNKIIIELKAVNTLESSHKAQVLNYLKATGFRLGILLNFGSTSLEYKRLVK